MGALILEVSPREYFSSLLIECQDYLQITLPEDVELYLISFLDSFISVEGNSFSDCLSLTLKEAKEASGELRHMLFKQIGETALYFSSFFQEFFRRKMFNISYYKDMGRLSFLELSKSTDLKLEERNVYKQVSEYFSDSISILTELGIRAHLISLAHMETLILYETWLNHASLSLEQELNKRHIIPVKGSLLIH